MSTDITTQFSVEEIKESKINQVDFETLVFGQVFTDHMFECDYIDGEWQTPTIKPYQPILVEPSLKVFHYGQAVFEGMKAYKDNAGEVWMFRPDQNQVRINKSAKRLAIPEFPKEWFFEALDRLLVLDDAWIKKGKGNVVYIRPFVIATENAIMAAPSTQYKFMIILSPVKSYFRGDVSVVFAEHYSRSADGGVGAAKAAGNYAGQFYPTNLAKEKGYEQVIWTDSNEHKYLEEAGTMNAFFRINDTLLTAPTSDRILDGVTRKSVLDIAKHLGMQVEVRKITVSEVVEAAKDGSLKEIFGAGTAVVISPVKSFSYQGIDYPIEKQKNSYAIKLKEYITDIQYNKIDDPFGWRYKVGVDKY
ncbi:MAG TPA: branched-chain amino acid aminotransferase [Lutibacter sp.]|nr:branched-chain amino acid aminotransferase [Lutibacter sp.]